MPFACCIIGTDTAVGKTHVLALLCHGLRQLQRRVWVHKPVACGDWQDGQAEDARRLRKIADPAQPAASICPYEFPAAASPHLAAAEHGASTAWRTMSDTITQLRTNAAEASVHDLLVEAAGGILAPLSSDRGTIMDICTACALPVVLVTRPHLGTLNHTQLSVREAQRHGLTVLGMVINYHHAAIDQDSLAIRTVKQELEQLCGVPVLAEIPYLLDGEAEAINTTAPNLATSPMTSSYTQQACALAERLLCTQAEYA